MTLKDLIEAATGGLTTDIENDTSTLLEYEVLVHGPDSTTPMAVEDIYAVDEDKTINIDVGRGD
jgi:hypothetical protein